MDSDTSDDSFTCDDDGETTILIKKTCTFLFNQWQLFDGDLFVAA